jgi:hypothetical protein
MRGLQADLLHAARQKIEDACSLAEHVLAIYQYKWVYAVRLSQFPLQF